MKYEGANVITVAGHPHDIRCPQSGRTDVTDCCKPMVAFTATIDERERCAKVAEEYEGIDGHDRIVARIIGKKIRESKP